MELKHEHIYLVRRIKDWRGNPVIDSRYELAQAQLSWHQEFYFFGSDETDEADCYEIVREIDVPEILAQMVRHD